MCIRDRCTLIYLQKLSVFDTADTAGDISLVCKRVTENIAYKRNAEFIVLVITHQVIVQLFVCLRTVIVV